MTCPALTRIGIATFILTVVSGSLYTVDAYSMFSNVVSELGAQHTQNNFIMIIGFILLGGGILIDGIKNFRIPLLPFMLFGLAMAAAGLFPHKPLDASLSFNPLYHSAHGIIASVAGTAITVGFIWQGIRSTGKQRITCYYMAAVAMVFPILMLFFENYQGLIQRVMYLQVLGWLWMKYPTLLPDQTPHPEPKGRRN